MVVSAGGVESLAAAGAAAGTAGAASVAIINHTVNKLIARNWETIPSSASVTPVSYTHLRAHETVLDLVCRLLLEKKNNTLHKIAHS